tara:strand:+ start:498 stop:899 length:402 start_codon:yes stop_codon:yes gene_type:complete
MKKKLITINTDLQVCNLKPEDIFVLSLTVEECGVIYFALDFDDSVRIDEIKEMARNYDRNNMSTWRRAQRLNELASLMLVAEPKKGVGIPYHLLGTLAEEVGNAHDLHRYRRFEDSTRAKEIMEKIYSVLILD